jgi:hypothetical protein
MTISMHRVVLALAVLLLAADGSAASCLLGKCTDADAVDALREQIAETCDCEFADSHKAYVKCAKQMVKAAVKDGTLPKQCKKSVKKCEAKSYCGDPEAVICCEQKKNGKVKAKVVKGAAKCTKGIACAGNRSALEACAPDGTCAQPIRAFKTVQEVFNASCSLPSCHSASSRQGNLVLDHEDLSYSSMVDQPSFHPTAASQGLMRVQSGEPANSFLVQKLRGTGAGDAMPQGQPLLSERTIVLIEDWIRRGAHSTAEECPALVGSDITGIRPLHGGEDVLTICDDEPVDTGNFEWKPQPPLPAPAKGEGIQLYTPPRTVEPGQEWETCVAFRPNWEQVAADAGYAPGSKPNIREQIYRMHQGSHHMLLYAYFGDEPGNYPEGYFDCVAGNCTDNNCPSDRRRIMPIGGTQVAGTEYEVQYPPGVGIPLGLLNPGVDPVIIVNLHYTNPFLPQQQIYGESWVNLYWYEPGAMRTVLDGIFGVNDEFVVEPFETKAISEIWRPSSIIPGLQGPTDAAIFQLFGHMHLRGRRFMIDRVTGGACSGDADRLCGRNDDCAAGQTCARQPGAQDLRIYDTSSWDNAPVVDYEPPYVVVDKEEGLRWTCEHSNGIKDDQGNEVLAPKRCHEDCNACGWNAEERTCHFRDGRIFDEGEPMPLVFGLLADDDMCNMFGYFLRQLDMCRFPEIADDNLDPAVIANCCEAPPGQRATMPSWVTDQCS